MKRDPLDPQKHLVYKWEDQWRYTEDNLLTQDETRRLLKRCFKVYDVRPPAIRFLPKACRKWSEYDIDEDVLTMSHSHCNHFIACHEAAHVIVHRNFGEEAQDHGPQFVDIYLDLLVREQVGPRDALEYSMHCLRIESLP